MAAWVGLPQGVGEGKGAGLGMFIADRHNLILLGNAFESLAFRVGIEETGSDFAMA